MRLIGHLRDEAQAGRFENYLYSKGIEGQVEEDAQGRWEVWVLNEEHVDPARAMLSGFAKNPDDPAFKQDARAGGLRKARDEKEDLPGSARVIDATTAFSRSGVSLGPLTLGLIATSAIVAAATHLDSNNLLGQLLSISTHQVEGEYITWHAALPEIRSGQVWRLVTPIFLHFGILHLLFNMLWLRDLGSMIETRKGTALLLALVLLTAVLSNLGQFLAGGPRFGGMSGVVYGLLGYIWMQGRYCPASQLALHNQTVVMMILWFFLCVFGVIPNIANTAHAVGLAVGIAWGYLAAMLHKR